MAFDNKRHTIAYSTKLDGLCFSFISNVDLDNGVLIARGELEEGEREIYKAEFDVTKPAYLVLDPAWQYDDSTYSKKYDEGMYYNEACKPFRGYELNINNGRRFEVSADDSADELAKGDYVIANDKGRLVKAAGESNPSNAFVGKVADVVTHGFPYAVGVAGTVDTTSKFYVIEVVKNEAVN